jgi:hypothetical protein
LISQSRGLGDVYKRQSERLDMSAVNEIQISGNHYKTAYQTWDFIDDFKLGYMEGNVIKYVQRHAKKAGSVDLNKATHYVQKMFELFAKGRTPQTLASYMKLAAPQMSMTEEQEERAFNRINDALIRFRECNSIEYFEMEIIQRVTAWETPQDLAEIESLLLSLTERVYPSIT